jgi:hypothetical protein
MSLVAQTRPLGLSLGDRACLAIGLALKAPAYTADKSWKNVKVGPLTNKRRSRELESENMYPEMHAQGLDLPQHVGLSSH